MEDKDIRCNILKEFGIIDEHPSGWTKVLSFVSWNGQPPKFDIRNWSEGREHMSRGATFTLKELRTVVDTIRREYPDKIMISQNSLDFKTEENPLIHEDSECSVAKVLCTINKDIEKGTERQLRIASWNGRPFVFDIREWTNNYETLYRGLTLKEHEMRNLISICSKI